MSLSAQPASPPPPDVAAAQKKASGSSFYAAMRLMPKAERDAMFAIYAFCRAVDDIADDGLGTRAERFAQLQSGRADLAQLYAGAPPPRLAFLTEAVARYRLKLDDFLAVIDGMEMDVAEDIRAPDFATLDLYCERVASAVGRLSVHVFGMEGEPALAIAHHLGRALQLTNILRDLDEDAARGRLYLPREALESAGLTSFAPHAVLSHASLEEVCAPVLCRAREHYDQADLVMAGLPKRAVKAPYMMAAGYRSILDNLAARGFAPPRAPVRASRIRLISAFFRHAFT